MAYDKNMINNYDHLQDSARPAHMGSKNSMPHLAGGKAIGDATMASGGGAREHNPGGATNVASRRGDSGIGRDM